MQRGAKGNFILLVLFLAVALLVLTAAILIGYFLVPPEPAVQEDERPGPRLEAGEAKGRREKGTARVRSECRQRGNRYGPFYGLQRSHGRRLSARAAVALA